MGERQSEVVLGTAAVTGLDSESSAVTIAGAARIRVVLFIINTYKLIIVALQQIIGTKILNKRSFKLIYY